MERTFNLVEDVEDLGTASIETLGPPGDRIEFGVLAQLPGLDRD
ncbi:benenodin family lasso peptide [Novosphingobium sp.]|nr:benenodin family lasso peptide [Novosphingobium sp.]